MVLSGLPGSVISVLNGKPVSARSEKSPVFSKQAGTNDLVLRNSAYLTSALIVAKENSVVLHDREAERTPELVAFEVPAYRVEVAPRIQLLIPAKYHRAEP